MRVVSLVEAIQRLGVRAPQLPRPRVSVSSSSAARSAGALELVGSADLSLLARAVGIPEHIVRSVCTQSRASLEWCTYLARLLRGESAAPPASAMPPGLEAIVAAVYSKLASPPKELRRLVEERARRLAEEIRRAVEEFRRCVREAVVKAFSARFREAERDFRRVVRAVAELRRFVPVEALAEVARLELERSFRHRFRAPAPEQLVRGFVEAIRGATPRTVESAARSLVELFRRAVVPRESEVEPPKPSPKRLEAQPKRERALEEMARLGATRLGRMVVRR